MKVDDYEVHCCFGGLTDFISCIASEKSILHRKLVASSLQLDHNYSRHRSGVLIVFPLCSCGPSYSVLFYFSSCMTPKRSDIHECTTFACGCKFLLIRPVRPRRILAYPSKELTSILHSKSWSMKGFVLTVGVSKSPRAFKEVPWVEPYI